ncbi:helix-turn-helix domain-containing protein [Chryseobacterium salivictor]|uniref:HTH araC/xylS-type domain-containing protein n=1 Tax=Chryseobacterium salivictor TaxID=2547600 RepID=A0A4P6ZFW1_9FLAO|nr:helix-turn-helix domain-containing protein [Chryseobacterium salivictor]QBO58382.1 hypothetical protein NBC122_01567 [Chryseobacterium salivictor]
MGRNILLLWILIGSVCTAQNSVIQYTLIQETYENLTENDARALPSVRKNIALGKKNQNFKHLMYAYEDAVYYSPQNAAKLKYADSAIAAATRTKDPALISKAYLGRGIVYYFNYRMYDKALHEYLFAAEYAEEAGDSYLIHKVKYHIGVVRNYLGYYQQAIPFFKECSNFFAHQLKSAKHSAVRYNNTRGYLNSTHQMTISYRHLGKYNKVDSLLKSAEPYLTNPQFAQEKGYFLKEKGIASFRNHRYREAIDTLMAATQLMSEKKDEGMLAVAWYYIGNSFFKMNDSHTGTAYLQKVDSLFRKNKLAVPEVHSTYELLFKKTDPAEKPEEATYYIGQLLKSDSILQAELPYLSSRIFREYDVKALHAEKEKLLKAKAVGDGIVIFSLIVSAALLSFLIRAYIREKRNTAAYQKLQLRLQSVQQDVETASPISDLPRKMEYSMEIVGEVLQKLQSFEDRHGFLDPDVTMATLGPQLGITKNHLSYVINEYKKMNFRTYLAHLRIQYITTLMNSDTDTLYLRMDNEALAQACGLRSRQQLSRLFHEINGITPGDFIRQRNKELNLN